MTSLKTLCTDNDHRQITILHTPQYTCTQLAATTLKQLTHKSTKTTTPSLPSDPCKQHAITIVIFCICSDNRIPKDLEDWMNQALTTQHVFLCILGDYDDDNGASWKIMTDETINIIRRHNQNLPIASLAIDTPIIDHAAQAEKIMHLVLNHHNDKTLSKTTPREPKSTPAHIPNTPAFIDNAYAKIAARYINGPLRLEKITIDNIQGLKLELSDQNPYPRSTLNTQNEEALKEFINAIANLPDIIALKIPFADMQYWPEVENTSFYSQLLKLDLRGNQLQDFTFLSQFTQLKRLNIAANHLKTLPKEVYAIKSLRRLYAYKNSIDHLDDRIAHLKNLTKLSMYRNLLTSIPETLTQCHKLAHINIGANPIKTLPKSIIHMQALKKLILRNCRLQAIPNALRQKHTIEVDMTKNCLVTQEVIHTT